MSGWPGRSTGRPPWADRVEQRIGIWGVWNGITQPRGNNVPIARDAFNPAKACHSIQTQNVIVTVRLSQRLGTDPMNQTIQEHVDPGRNPDQGLTHEQSGRG